MEREFETLYTRYRRPIAGIARKLARGDEELYEDLQQEGALALWQLNPDRANTNRDAWIRTAIRNRMVDFLRRYNPAQYESLDSRLEVGDQVEQLDTGELYLITYRPMNNSGTFGDLNESLELEWSEDTTEE